MNRINGNGTTTETTPQPQHQPKLDERFISDIKGKEFCLYAGLLDLAHQMGLLKLEVEFIQVPTKENGFICICKATVTGKNGETYSNIGDANPTNVNKMIVPHLIRMASTRAKARALRDYTNIGLCCLEELGDLEEADEQPVNQQAKSYRNGKQNRNISPK